MTPFHIRDRIRTLGTRLGSRIRTLVDRTPVTERPTTQRALNPVREALDTLRHGDFDERLRSAARLGDLGDPLAVDGLVNALRDQAAEVAAAAATSLGRLHARQARDPLAEVAANGDGYHDTLARRAAIDALVEVAGIDAVPALLPLVRDIDADVSRHVIERLGELADARSGPALWDVVRNADGYFLSVTRCAAIDALAAIGRVSAAADDDGTVTAAVTSDSLRRIAAEEPDPQVRAHAERALAS